MSLHRRGRNRDHRGGGNPMRTYVARTGSQLLLTAGLLAGCQSSAPRAPYADNPLLQARPGLTQSYGGNDRLAQIAQNGTKTVVPPPLPASATYPPPPTVAAAPPAPDLRPAYAP